MTLQFSKPSTGKKYLIGDEASFLENGKLKQVKLEDGKEVLILRVGSVRWRVELSCCAIDWLLRKLVTGHDAIATVTIACVFMSMIVCRLARANTVPLALAARKCSRRYRSSTYRSCAAGSS